MINGRMLIRMAVLALLPLSCMREPLSEVSREGEILFSLADTKAALVENATAVAETYGEAGIGLIAYSYMEADGERTRYPSGTEAWDSFDYEARGAYRLTRDGHGLWHTDVHSLRWSRDVNYLAFYAYAPFDLPVTSGTHSMPVLSGFTVEDPATQTDILVASTTGLDAMPPVSAQRVPLVFTHPLAALEIDNRTDYPLSQVELVGVRDRASAYSFSDGTWTLDEHKVTYALSGVAAGEKSQKYLLLPQDLSGITLRFVANGKTVAAHLSGRWEPGQLFTYTVDDRVWKYVLDIPVTQLDLDFGPTEHVVAVESYKTDGFNQVQADWSVNYFSNAACTVPVSRPSWLTVSGNPTAGEAGAASSLTISSLENNAGGVEQLQGDEAIRKATEKGLWNLAHQNGTYGRFTESANCYIVNGPGWYVLPLVMGNAIKDGNWNYGAFNGMTDYKGNIIQYDARLGGWVQNPSTGAGVRSGVPTSAKVLWEDVDGLIATDGNYVLPAVVQGYSSPVIGSIDPSNGNSMYQLVFNIPTWLTRMRGNAVIGVFDADGLLMWSWHIWVTDYVPGQGDVTAGGVRFMPQNLGEVRYVNTYPEHTVYVKISSEGDSRLSRVIKVVKAGGEGTHMTRSYNPYYQHGRKDPFIPGVAGSLDDLPVYGVNSLTSRTEERSAIRSGGGVAAQLTVGAAIQHPNYYGASTGGSQAWYWTSALHANFWGSTKTIYDPSPVGYRVPTSAQLENLAGDIPMNNRRSSNPGGGNYPGQLVLNNGVAHAALWSADVDGDNNARYLRVQGNGHVVASIRGREALAVRPVAD